MLLEGEVCDITVELSPVGLAMGAGHHYCLLRAPESTTPGSSPCLRLLRGSGL